MIDRLTRRGRPGAAARGSSFPPRIMQPPDSVPAEAAASIQAASPEAPYAAEWRSYAGLRWTLVLVFFGGIAAWMALLAWIIWFELIEALPAARLAGLIFGLGPVVWGAALLWLGARITVWPCPRCKELFGLTRSACAKCGLPRWAVNDEGARLAGRREAPRIGRPIQ